MGEINYQRLCIRYFQVKKISRLIRHEHFRYEVSDRSQMEAMIPRSRYASLSAAASEDIWERNLSIQDSGTSTKSQNFNVADHV